MLFKNPFWDRESTYIHACEQKQLMGTVPQVSPPPACCLVHFCLVSASFFPGNPWLWYRNQPRLGIFPSRSEVENTFLKAKRAIWRETDNLFSSPLIYLSWYDWVCRCWEHFLFLLWKLDCFMAEKIKRQGKNMAKDEKYSFGSCNMILLRLEKNVTSKLGCRKGFVLVLCSNIEPSPKLHTIN